jgi:hypothetical protein
MDNFDAYAKAPIEPALSIAAEIMKDYWARVERLVRVARQNNMDVAVSSPRFEQGSEPGQWNLVWEHQMLEKGAMPVSRPDQTWHVYRRD